MNKKLYLIFTLLGAFIISESYAQQFAPSIYANGGDYFAQGNATLSWTIGEPITEIFSSSGYTFTQGFQQVFDTSTIGIENYKNNPQISVFPNPATDVITVSFSSADYTNINLLLYNVQGKLMYNQTFDGSFINKTIDIQSYPIAIYLLKVLISDSGSVESKILKIIKF